MPAPAEDALTLLAEFIADSFRVEEIWRFLGKLPNGGQLGRELPEPPVSRVHAAETLVGLLNRRGMLDRDFFAKLTAERPGRSSEISEIMARLFPSQRLTARPVARRFARLLQRLMAVAFVVVLVCITRYYGPHLYDETFSLEESTVADANVTDSSHYRYGSSPPPPPHGPSRKAKLPPLQKFTIANGLDVYVVENHEIPLVTIQLLVRAGTMDDPILAKLTAMMLSPNKMMTDAYLPFDPQTAGDLKVESGMHDTTFKIIGRAADTSSNLERLADALRFPHLTSDDVELLKGRASIIFEIANSRPNILADRLFAFVAYPQAHPYGRKPFAAADIDAIDSVRVETFYNQFYRSNNSVLIVAGDIAPSELQPHVERAFSSWSPIPGSAPANPLNGFIRYELPKEMTFHTISYPTARTAEIRIGNLALARKHPDWVKASIASDIFGGGVYGQLPEAVMINERVATSAESTFWPGQAPGTWRISMRSPTETTPQAITSALTCISYLRSGEIDEVQLDEATARLNARFAMDLETAEQVADQVRALVSFGIDWSALDTYESSTREIPIDEIRTAIAKYMHATPIIVVVGEATRIEGPLRSSFPKSRIFHYDRELNCLERDNPVCTRRKLDSSPILGPY